MEQFEEVIRAIKRAEDYPQQLQTVYALITDDHNKVQRAQVKELLSAMSRIVTAADSPPNSKFYTIMIAKEFTSRQMGDFISLLSSSQLLQDMVKLAKEVDPQKKMTEKGVTLFSGNKEIGNRYITLILECLVVWAERFPRTKAGDSKYALAYADLISKKVTLPKEFIYFERGTRQNSRRQPEQTRETPQPKEPAPGSAESHVRLSLAKIEGFHSFIMTCQDEDELTRECIKYHKSFQDDMKKLQTSSNQYMETLSEDLIGLYLEIVQFYHNEGETYKQSMEERKDISAYVNLAQVELQGIAKHFEGGRKTRKKPEASSSQLPGRNTKSSQNRVQKPNRTESQKPRQSDKNIEPAERIERQQLPPPPKLSDIRKIESQNAEVRRRLEQEDKEPNPNSRQTMQRTVDRRESRESRDETSKVRAPEINIHQLEHEAEQGEEHIKQLLSVSAAGGVGFNSVRMQLQKEKGSASHYHSKLGRMRQRSHTPVENYRSRSRNDENFNSSLSQSKISVFEMFPDVVVSRTDYSGKIIPMHLDYARTLLDISEAQGPRRFKASNFKQKSLLFEHRDLQVGFKSSAHYRDLDHFKQCLKITMFMGNKSEETMTHFSVEFQGDRTCLIYANPQKIEPTVEAGFQAKQELLVIPVELPFGLITMKVKYTLDRQVHRHTIALPITIWKFVSLKRMDVDDFNREYTSIRRDALRTAPFRLSRSLPPGTLRRYLSQLTELTDYQTFLQQKSYTEYKLCSAMTVMNLHDYLLKLRVRPDMSVVVQLVPRTNEASAQQLGSFVLQSLQFLLQRTATER